MSILSIGTISTSNLLIPEVLCGAQTRKWCFQGQTTWAPNLLVGGFPCTSTDRCLKRCLDSPTPFTFVVLSPVLTYPLVLLLPFFELALTLSLCLFSLLLELLHYSSSFLFYSLSLVRVQIITISSFPMQSHFYLESQGKITPSKDSFEACSRHQIAFGNELPKALIVLGD